MSGTQELARELEAAVTAVPGVVMLYPAQPAPVAAVVSLVARVAGAEEPALVAVSESADGAIGVSVTIGVSETVSAADTCRAVYAAIVAQLAAAELEPGSVRVLVGAIT